MVRIMSSIIGGQAKTIANGNSVAREARASSSPITTPAATPT
jgi:hypothetical protein